MKYFVVLFIMTTLFAGFFVAPNIFAQITCTIIYGGGLKSDNTPYCMEAVAASQHAPTSPTQKQMQKVPAKSGFTTPQTMDSANSPQAKGSITLYPAPTAQSNPNTGPEMLGLLALIPAALAGFTLRKKATK